MKGRSRKEQVAATRIEYGTDINFGELCNQLLKILKKNKNFSLKVNSNVLNVSHTNDESFELKYKSHKDGKVFNIKSNKVFIGAGGMSINLLQNIGIEKVKGYAGYPISGEWLICSNKKLIKQHRTKIYGLPFPKAPAMSIPHLDLRVINGHETLLFGPYASFTTKFLKHGSKLDFFNSIKPNNICSLLIIFFKNFPLLRYLIHQSFMTHQEKINQLKKFYPSVNIKDWQTKSAGQRVQIIKKTPKGIGLEFGTEILYSSKKNLAGLIGASPGASTACSLMLDVMLNIYDDPKLPNKIKKMLPWYDLKLNENPKTLKKIRSIIYKKLNLV